jgi:plasmid stabilization system protein ParE
VKLRYSLRASADIDQILAYIAQHSRSGATSVARQIRATTELLAQYPNLGRRSIVPSVRVFPVARYPFVLYHRVKGDELIILHVPHASRALPSKGDLKRWRD